ADKYNGPIALQFHFDARIAPPGLRVVIEDADRYEIRVNGQIAHYDGAPYYIDRAFHPVPIGDLLRLGENTIELLCDFAPVGRPSFGLADLYENREGTELESIYLIGDFAVDTKISDRPARAGCVRFAPAFALVREPTTVAGDLSAHGYPFYAGRIALIRTVALRAPDEGERIVLTLPGVNAALAKVRINGRDAGALPWPPYQLDITGHVLDGDNRIAIELTSGLRNLLGPHHRACGESPSTWHTSFDCPPDHNKPYPGVDEPNWTDDYFMTHFGVFGTAAICYQRQT
ncbi:MAG: hypothetical protein IT440_04180, partial [Phycisphaeraceae bacterium]|nr:hypothetical protein [Phycisphaeraceae bacterium]